jgi:anti-sigma regulatory factor (Ser/Thr protein kinase)
LSVNHGAIAPTGRLDPGRETCRQDLAAGVRTRVCWAGPAIPAIVAQARRAVGEFAFAGVSSARRADIRLCVSEAVSNAVLHAFDGAGPHGTVTISAEVGVDALDIVVVDGGKGVQPGSDNAGLGLGRPLIAALADWSSVARGERGGTEVAMRFVLDQPQVAPRQP